jgi:uncharacterized membrane protein
VGRDGGPPDGRERLFVQDCLAFVSTKVIVAIEAMALLNIVIGTVQAFFTGLGAMLVPTATNLEVRDVWVRYAHWLVAGLTFQLAADNIETTIAPDWVDRTAGRDRDDPHVPRLFPRA